MFSLKPDYEQTRTRMEAFWRRERCDRPLVQFGLAKPAHEQMPLPRSRHADDAARWMDAQYQAEYALAMLSNQIFMGDALPIAYPNLGPEVFSAFYGCPLHFGEYGTSWTDPVLEDWEQVDTLQFDWQHPYLLRLREMMDAFLALGKDTFIVGMPDWHPGGDAIAAFRDPQNFAVDMITHPAEVQRLLKRIEGDYFQLYDEFYGLLRGAGMPITSWLPLTAEDKYYIPSNDFSIMISKKMYNKIFLPGIINECRFFNHSIYHLDGPGALRHLDSILAIPELDALQWVAGAGNEGFAQWIPVYQRAQAAGKGIIVYCGAGELNEVMTHLSPVGMCLSISGVESAEAGENILRAAARWS